MVSSTSSLLSPTAQSLVAQSVDATIGNGLSNTVYINSSSISPTSSSVRVVQESQGSLVYVTTKTTVVMSSFPTLQSSPELLYASLTQTIDAGVSGGSMTTTLNQLAGTAQEVSVESAVFLSARYSNMQVYSPSTASTQSSESNSAHSGGLSAALVGVTVSFVLVGAFLIGFGLFFAGRYLYRRNETLKAVKSLSAPLGIADSYPNKQGQSFCLTNFDVEKLEYEGDVVYHC